MSTTTLLLATLLVIFAVSFTSAQTYSNCKEFSAGGFTYKVEWTLSETANQLSARFLLPNSAGYAAIGFKTSGSTMAGSTILLGYGASNVNEVSFTII